MTQPYKKRDLLENKLFKRLILNRNLQPVLQFLAFLPFVFIVVTGIIGTSLGAKNFAIAFTWILWSVLLQLILIPFMGRVWCLVCPIVWPGELIQRKLWSRYGTSRLFNLRWPKALQKVYMRWPRALQNVWIQNFIFLFFAIWIVVLVTQPFVTALVVIILIAVAMVVFMLFPRRIFCRYLCPPSLFIGIYSTFSPIEVRVKDKEVCLKPRSQGGCDKECYVGTEKGYGCPWYEFPQTMVSNIDCGLCMECFKTCPLDNIALNIRPWWAEAESKDLEKKSDEAWRVLSLLGLSIVYTSVLFGPWSWIKNWGNLLELSIDVGLLQHLFFAILVIDIAFGIFPGLHLLASAGSKFVAGARNIPTTKLFVEYAYAYIPLGLMLWGGFNFSLIMMEWSYIPVVASDPFGAGWNLLGSTHFPWIPISLPIPIAEIAFAALGIILSIKVGYTILRRNFPVKSQAIKALIPFAIFTVGVAALFLWFYI